MLSIKDQVEKLGNGPLSEDGLREHIWPLFSRVLNSSREIYLANHSLGRPLDQTSSDIQRGVDLWYDRLDAAWESDGWPAEMGLFRQRMANLIGLENSKCIVPKTSAGQGLRAVLNAHIGPTKIVTTTGEFDSVDFILKTYEARGQAQVEWVQPNHHDQGIPIFSVESLLPKIIKGVNLVVVSAVFFGTGQVLPGLEKIVQRAHEVGALVMVDAYHAAGVIPLAMQSSDIDFMIGGSYKYARGGPGACWLAIHPRVLASGLQTLDTGWFAKKDPFGFQRPDDLERGDGGDAWMESTPAALTVYQTSAGLELNLAIGIARLREYNLHQQATLRAAFRSYGVRHFTPDDPNAFGAFTLVTSEDANGLVAKLKTKGVNTDARGNAARFGPDLLNSTEELERAAFIASEFN
ncbi:MAG: aminotransferase class V-fold PLP-dependent enzyme [Fimbriimonadaceae bacterium]